MIGHVLNMYNTLVLSLTSLENPHKTKHKDIRDTYGNFTSGCGFHRLLSILLKLPWGLIECQVWDRHVTGIKNGWSLLLYFNNKRPAEALTFLQVLLKKKNNKSLAVKLWWWILSALNILRALWASFRHHFLKHILLLSKKKYVSSLHWSVYLSSVTSVAEATALCLLEWRQEGIMEKVKQALLKIVLHCVHDWRGSQQFSLTVLL